MKRRYDASHPVAILWDIDGTLLRGGRGAVAAWHAAVQAELGTDIDWKALDTSGATDVFIAAQICLLAAGAAPVRVEQLLERYLRELPGYLREDPPVPLPNVAEVLAQVDSDPGFVNLFLTGNLRGAAWAKLAAAGLGDFLWDGAFGEHGPERNRVAAAARRLVGERWGETVPLLVIGDTPRDIAAARAIGARVIAVATGSHSREKLAGLQPDAVFERLPEVGEFALAVEEVLDL
jgi:phosphoglycolate phosphatase-like HAD superfamily hydrolase